MRDKAQNKMLAPENDARDPRYPDTAPEKLRERYGALVRRRAKNKLRRRSKQKQRT